MARLKDKYREEIVPKLMESFGYKSPMQAPRLKKIVLNMGVGEAKQNTNMLDAATEQLAVIAGQRPSVRRARKSIAAFKVREGMPVGVAVTLRGERMFEMLDRLVAIAMPRIRDFRGLSARSFDGRGNFSIGIKEQIVFPEVDYDSIDQVRGLDVTITTSAKSDEEAFELLRALGMPFKDDIATGKAEIGHDEEEERRREEARARAEAEQAALEELKQENPEAYAKKLKAEEEEEEEEEAESAPEAEADDRGGGQAQEGVETADN